ncbi:uncharacterized protein PITG_06539 [Phytophthora infestans T30-4]|uniref:Uncharacterized protein n=2 Tax=Phytophthora infestans TaxID=4787 RepID=D0N530_PHYIT|nr:uncharacterized protein PITG_06539 [Phytophthora infestans T30-4]EEY69988.1 conserved hypothetical protein [Phytophthora infestans T30-4]KAF4039324.1 hypothetical protein GN244_ATG08457 [Phytophthora infestans]KAI9983427.1 hypothetical protein PInf_007458 [Phytophthora infestans]|eukprot:XP_002998635.1 conserved hypothetical protein [Phytophthora infestans T30-4]
MPPKQALPRETRNEREQFMYRLESRSVEERKYKMNEHTAFLTGEREKDADFGTGAPPPPVVARTPRPTDNPPKGKDVSFLRAQKRLILQQQRAVAVKTVTASGKKAPAAKRVKPKDDDYVPDDDEEEEDEHPEDEWEDKPMAPFKTAKRKAKSKTNATAKPSAKSRKLSADQIAKAKAM